MQCFLNISADDILKYFSYLFPETSFEISKLSPLTKLSRKYQSLFTEKTRKPVINLSSTGLGQSVGCKDKLGMLYTV